MTVRPCARPKVVIGPHPYQSDGVVVRCQVPGCDFQYPSDLQFVALASDGSYQATMHRELHRLAMPKTRIVRDVEWDVHCDPCGGHRRTFATKREAQTWLDEHLANEHGVVTTTPHPETQP